MNNRRLSLLVVSLLLVTVFFQFVVFEPDVVNAPGVTWYVDGDNTTPPYLGTLADPFWAIQHGIDAASDGDIVYVFNGSYKFVTIDRSISLIGADKSNTSINAGGPEDVVYITANWVNVTGFTIKDSGSDTWNAGIRLENVNYCRIYDNNISNNNNYGILANHSDHNYFENNNMTLNTDHTIMLRYSSYNQILDNYLIENFNRGIVLYISSHNNTITGNYLAYNNNWAIQLRQYSGDTRIEGNEVYLNNNWGIFVDNSDNTLISKNNVTYNKNWGIFVDYSDNVTVSKNNVTFNENYGIIIDDSTNVLITENNVSKNENYGVRVSDCNNCTIIENNITFNKYHGIQSSDSEYLEIFENEIIANRRSGIHIDSFTMSPNNITIKGNNITSNWHHGIYMDEAIFSEIQENDITSNNFTGILFEGCWYNDIIDNNISDSENGIRLDYDSENNTIDHNHIFSNDKHGISFDYSSFNNILNNNISDHNYGVRFNYSHNNIMLYNNLTNHNIGFYLWYSNNSQIGHNTVIDSSVANFGSCPVLYTWDGEQMKQFGDINGPGGLGYRMDMSMSGGGVELRAPTTLDYTAIDGSDLVPKDGSYILDIAEDMDEITYFDEAELWVIDHDPGVEIYSPEAALATQIPYLHSPVIHTVRDPVPPVSATDWHGQDIMSVIETPDEVYTEAELMTDNYITLDLGDLSGASQIKLVYRAYTDWAPIGQVKLNQYVEVKNALGEWELVSDTEHFGKPEAMPRTYVIDITTWFKTDDWHVRLHTGTVKIHVDWIAVDTTLDESVDVTVLEPTYADHYKKEDHWDFEYFYGNFTKYGDVLPLLEETDDKYVIMRTGDSVELRFDEQPAPPGERDFWLVTDCFFKQPFVKYLLGSKVSTVEPLPFHGMTNYPYPQGESYPYDADHRVYLETWNTRRYEGGEGAGMSLPMSDNNTVFNNVIIGNSGCMGLALASETNTKVIDNEISKTYSGITLDWSDGITVKGNEISDNFGTGVGIWSTTNSTFTDNTMTGCGIRMGGNYLEYWNTHDIDTTNTVNTKPVYYWKSQTIGTIPDGAGQVILANCSNIIVEQQEVTHGAVGITLGFSTHNIISGNNASSNVYGIYLKYSSNNSITMNEMILSKWRGMELANSDYNLLQWNYVAESIGDYGMYIIWSSYNDILLNDIGHNDDHGIYISSFGNYNNVTMNDIFDNHGSGIRLQAAFYNNVSHNSFLNNDDHGIYLSSSDYNNITHNLVSNNLDHGFYFTSSDYNRISRNNIIDNNVQAYDNSDKNLWNESYPFGGNYWNDWTSPDSLSGAWPQSDPGSDGIVDNEYVIDADSIDYYPFISLVEEMAPTISNRQPPDGGSTNIDPPTISASYTDASMINESSVMILVDGWDVTPSASITQTGFSVVPPVLGTGMHDVYLEVRDIFGNLGTASWSFEIDTTPPAAISGMTASNPTHNSITLTWTASGDDVSTGTATAYEVRYNTAGPVTNANWGTSTEFTQSWVPLSAGSTETRVVSGLVPNTQYWFAVKAIDDASNYGLISNSPTETTSGAVVPTAPQSLQVTPGDGIVELTWSAPGSDGGSPITNYKIYRGTTSGGESLHAIIGNVLSHTDSEDVTNGVTYYYKILAHNAIGDGPLSEGDSTTPSAPPDAPTGLTAEAGDSYIYLTWIAPSSDGGTTITNYRVHRGTSSGAETFLTQRGNVLYFNDTSVTNGITYYYKISAKNALYEGDLSEEASGTPRTVPEAPQSIKTTAGDGFVNISWRAPDDDGGSNITNYRIYKGTTPGGEAFLIEIGNNTYYIDTSVTNGETYYYMVKAKNALGESSFSSEVDAVPDVDSDGDGVPNRDDDDDDNDGTLDTDDDLPLDPNEDTDTDGDDIGNNADTDDDGDGVEDVSDAFPLNASESLDTDSDGIGNNADPDDDNDGYDDDADDYPLNPNKWEKAEESILEETWFLLMMIVLIIAIVVVILMLLMRGRKVSTEEEIEQEIFEEPYQEPPFEEKLGQEYEPPPPLE